MFDGAVGIAVVVIIGFAVFIVWAKSQRGQATLRNTLGEPHSFRKRQRLAKRRAAMSGSRPAKAAKTSATTTKRSAR
ncbi:MAG TPA: hypothetical protein VFB38_19745 [Chthonomonadaceae bacterium]|nr:hypothetical protein [Chthonomonadaceae bacterium]